MAGRIVRRDGRARRGDSLLGAGVSLDPERARPRVYRWAGRCRKKGGLPRPANTTTLPSSCSPNSAAAYLNLGGLHEELGKMAEAEESLPDRAAKLQPTFALPHRPSGDAVARQAARCGPGGPRGTVDRREAGPGASRPAACLPWPMRSTAAANTLGPPTAFARQTPWRWKTTRSAAITSPIEHERFVDGLMQRVRSRLVRPAGERRLEQPPARLRLRPAALGHDVDRASAGEPLSDSRGGRVASGPAVVRGDSRPLGRTGPPRDSMPFLDRPTVRRLAEQHLAALAAIDGGRNRAHRRQDARQLYVSRSACASCSRDAVFIHSRRDLRDVAVSCWMTDFRSIRWANDREHIASRFQQYVG